MYRYEGSGVLSGLSRVRCMTAQRRAHLLHARTRSGKSSRRSCSSSSRRTRTSASRVQLPAVAARPGQQREIRRRTTRCGSSASACCAKRSTRSACPTSRRRRRRGFYGPKIDFHLADVMGQKRRIRPSSSTSICRTSSSLEYIGADGKEHRPVIIHRAIFSTMERMMSYSDRALWRRVSAVAGARAGWWSCRLPTATSTTASRCARPAGRGGPAGRARRPPGKDWL